MAKQRQSGAFSIPRPINRPLNPVALRALANPVVSRATGAAIAQRRAASITNLANLMGQLRAEPILRQKRQADFQRLQQQIFSATPAGRKQLEQEKLETGLKAQRAKAELELQLKQEDPFEQSDIFRRAEDRALKRKEFALDERRVEATEASVVLSREKFDEEKDKTFRELAEAQTAARIDAHSRLGEQYNEIARQANNTAAGQIYGAAYGPAVIQMLNDSPEQRKLFNAAFNKVLVQGVNELNRRVKQGSDLELQAALIESRDSVDQEALNALFIAFFKADKGLKGDLTEDKVEEALMSNERTAAELGAFGGYTAARAFMDIPRNAQQEFISSLDSASVAEKARWEALAGLKDGADPSKGRSQQNVRTQSSLTNR